MKRKIKSIIAKLIVCCLVFGLVGSNLAASEVATASTESDVIKLAFADAGLDGADGTPSGFKLVGDTSDAGLPKVVHQGSWGLQIQTASKHMGPGYMPQQRQFTFDIAESGMYKIDFEGSLYEGYGIGRLDIDSTALGSYNFYTASSSLVEGPLQEMGTVYLSAGTHTITLTCDGKQEESGWYYLGPRTLFLEKLPDEGNQVIKLEFADAGLNGADGTPSGFKLVGDTEVYPKVVSQGSMGLQIQTAGKHNPDPGYMPSQKQFTFEIAESGKYKVDFEGSLYEGYGIGRLDIDSTALGSYNFYTASSSLVEGPVQEMGTVILSAGTHTITLTCDGKQEESGWYYLGPRTLSLEKLPDDGGHVPELTELEFSKAGLNGADGTPSGFKLIGDKDVYPKVVAQASFGLQIQTAGIHNPDPNYMPSLKKFNFVTDKPGMYKVNFEGGLYPGFGIGELSINGTILGRYDFYSADTSLLVGPLVNMGKIYLPAGTHVMTLTCVGKNDQSSWYYMEPRRLLLELLPPELISVHAETDDDTRVLIVNEPYDTLGWNITGEMSNGAAADLSAAETTFASLNEEVLEVSADGRLHPKAPGKATIKVGVTLNGIRQETKVNFIVVTGMLERIEMDVESPMTVSKKQFVTVSGYDADNNSLDLGEAAISYTSSNPDVAYVSKYGMVTAMGIGSAQVGVSVELLGVTRTASASIEVVSKPAIEEEVTSFTDRWGVIPHTQNPILIDGNPGDFDSTQSLTMKQFRTIFSNEEANPDTTVQLTYDSMKLYVGVTGYKKTPGEILPSEGLELVLQPKPGSSMYYGLKVMLKEDEHRILGTNLGPGVFRSDPQATLKQIQNSEIGIVDGTEKWTVEIAIPLASLDVDQIASGEEWGLNVIRYRPETDPVSSLMPMRNSNFTDNESPNYYTIYLALTDQGRMARVFFDQVPSRMSEQLNAQQIARWVPNDLKLRYKSYNEKVISLSAPELSADTEFQLRWIEPSGRISLLNQPEVSSEHGRLRIGFTHPKLGHPGLYQIELIAKNEQEQTARMAVIAFDSEHAIEAGEKSADWTPGFAALDEVNPASPSDQLQQLLNLIPDKAGMTWAGLPERPDLRPAQLFTWDPEHPDQLSSPYSSLTYPNAQYPEDRTFEVKNAKGETVVYPYYQDEEGRRYFFSAQLWHKQREYVIKKTKELALSDPLGAARLLKRFGEVFEGYVPVYDTIWQNRPLDHDKRPPNPEYGGFWHFIHYYDLWVLGDLADAFAAVKQTDAFEIVSQEAGYDVQQRLVEKMFKPSVQFSDSYINWNTNLDYAIWLGLIKIGTAIDKPEYVHQALDRMEAYINNEYMFDGFFKEVTYSYHLQSTNGIGEAINLLQGYSDPQGYFSQRDGMRVNNLDLKHQFPSLARSLDIIKELTYPNGHYLPITDTWAAEYTDPDTSVGSKLWSAAGISRLTMGDGPEQSQLYMMYSPKFGHNHWDPLNLTLFAHGQELMPDLGYTHSKYTNWTLNTLAHNTVVVNSHDALELGKPGGNLETFASADGLVQVMKANENDAYDEVTQYDREPWYIAFPGSQEGYVLDMFRVSGGERHEYTLQGDPDRDAVFTTHAAMEPYGPYLLPEGTNVIEPENELETGSADGHYPAYACKEC